MEGIIELMQMHFKMFITLNATKLTFHNLVHQVTF